LLFTESVDIPTAPGWATCLLNNRDENMYFINLECRGIIQQREHSWRL